MGNLPFQPPPGMVSNDTVFAAPGRWRRGSWVRFWEGNWQVKGGYERLTLDNLGGVCRTVFGWDDREEEANIAFGLHNGLKAWRGGQLADITPLADFTAGQTDGTGGRGYGTGAYGLGEYGEPSDVDYFPLTWSLAAWGGALMANPRGQGIFYWDGVIPGNAALVATAPAQVTYMTVAPQRQVMAFGCNEEVSGDFNPLCIRWSDIEDHTDWASLPTNNAGEYILESGGRIVCARMVGDYVLVWTSVSLFLGTFIGDPGQTWKFERVGANCGAIGPNAPVIRAQTAMWFSGDRQFWSYSLGAAPVIVDCPIRDMFKDNISQGQTDKIVGATVSAWGELVWFYPDSRDGLECSRAVTMGPGGWYPDIIARSAYVDAGPHVSPVGVSPSGSAYWHEKGTSADGGILQGFLESTDFYASEADGGVMFNGVWPDFKNQVGVFQLTLFGREHPQDVERTFGPWALAPGRKRKSFRMASRIVRVRYDFASAPCQARGGKPEFDVQEIGGR
jgi:hypothetical protein